MPAAALAAEDVSTLRQEVEQLKREVQELRQILKTQKEAAKPATQEEIADLRKEVAKAQSEWKDPVSTKHFAGYADVGYTDSRKATGTFSTARFNPGFHYQYADLVLVDAELELAVTPAGKTETALEFTTVNVLLNDYAALFAGKFLSPIGQFRQNLHPSWINKLPSAPTGFGHDQGAPTSEVGAGLRGGAPIGGMGFNYAVYVGNGPRLELNGAGDEIEMIESEGAVSNPSGKKVWGTRIGLRPIPKLEVGVSGALGKVVVESEPTRSYSVAGADAAYQWRNLDLRAEYVRQKVGDLAVSVAPMPSRPAPSHVSVGPISRSAMNTGGGDEGTPTRPTCEPFTIIGAYSAGLRGPPLRPRPSCPPRLRRMRSATPRSKVGGSINGRFEARRPSTRATANGW